MFGIIFMDIIQFGIDTIIGLITIAIIFIIGDSLSSNGDKYKH